MGHNPIIVDFSDVVVHQNFCKTELSHFRRVPLTVNKVFRRAWHGIESFKERFRVFRRVGSECLQGFCR